MITRVLKGCLLVFLAVVLITLAFATTENTLPVWIALTVIVGIITWRATAPRTSKPKAEAYRYERDPEPDDSPERDNWEGSFWEVLDPMPVRARLRLDYVDGNGQRTERSVETREFGGFAGASLIIGHCSLRDATRTFRTDRIRQCVDEDTGEIIDDVESYLRQKYEASPEASLSRLLETDYDTLRILLYVGKADGQLRAKEKAIIRETCVALSGDSRMTDEIVERLVRDLDVPTLTAFRLAVGRVAKRDLGARTELLAAAERMIRTQKTVHPHETVAIQYLRERFGDDNPRPEGTPPGTSG